jgi:ribonuclease P protein component
VVLTALFFTFQMVMSPSRLKFPSAQRLKKMKSFRALLENGNTIKNYPLRIIWCCIPYDGDSNLKVAFSVPKRRFKSAVDRNKLKRIIRESHRLHSQDLNKLLSDQDKTCHILFQYQSNDIIAYNKIENSVKEILRKIKCG